MNFFYKLGVILVIHSGHVAFKYIDIIEKQCIDTDFS